MIEYTILEDAILEAIIGRVNVFIGESWEPLGGIQVVAIDQYHNKRYCQAMTRDKRRAEATEKRQDIIKERASAGIDQVLEEYAEED